MHWSLYWPRCQIAGSETRFRPVPLVPGGFAMEASSLQGRHILVGNLSHNLMAKVDALTRSFYQEFTLQQYF
jgi:hypothetical protein